MKKTFLMALLTVLIAVVAWAQTDSPLVIATVKPTLSASPETPIRGQGVAIKLTGVADPSQWQATFTYRPNSETAETAESAAFDATGTLHWKPKYSGLVKIDTKGPGEKDTASINVAVRFPSPPIAGIVILLIAGTILFGGAGWSLTKALKEK